MGIRYNFFFTSYYTVASKVGQRRQHHDERTGEKKKERQKIIKGIKTTLVAVYTRARHNNTSDGKNVSFIKLPLERCAGVTEVLWEHFFRRWWKKICIFSFCVFYIYIYLTEEQTIKSFTRLFYFSFFFIYIYNRHATYTPLCGRARFDAH